MNMKRTETAATQRLDRKMTGSLTAILNGEVDVTGGMVQIGNNLNNVIVALWAERALFIDGIVVVRVSAQDAAP